MPLLIAGMLQASLDESAWVHAPIAAVRAILVARYLPYRVIKRTVAVLVLSFIGRLAGPW